MKKIYLIGAFTALAATSFAQWNVTSSPNRRNFTRAEISPRASVHQELVHASWENRLILLSQDFQGVTGAMPAALPAGYTTTSVTQADGSMGNAFKVHNSTTANGGGYWPVPSVGANNKFAGANDDNTPCDCDNIDSYLQLPALDFSAATNIAISFDIFHDKNFGGGDATLQISTDGGTTFNVHAIGVDATGADITVFPADQDYWQSLVVPVYDLNGAASVIIRFQWTDGGSWASGFAVDNIVVGEMPANDLRMVKTKIGDWNQANFGLGFWDYNRVPVNQVSPVHATSVIFNGGSNDQTDATVNFDIQFNGTSVAGSPFAGDQVSASFLSLDKDTISVSSTYTPSALGTVTVNSSTASTTGDDDNSNNNGTTSLEITQFTYGRDAGAAQAFVGPGADFEIGNLFDIYADDMIGGIDVAIGANSIEGDPIIGRIYLFEGFDGTGAPIFTDLNAETSEHTIAAADLNTVNGSTFVSLTFPTAIALTAGNVYLATVVCTADTRIPVSGSNEWVTSWLYDGTNGWGATGSVPMVRLNSDETAAVSSVAGSTDFTLSQNMPNPSTGNTTVVYNLPSAERVTVTVRDLTGRVVSQMNEGVRPAGKNMLTLNTESFGAGIYTYTVTAGSNSLTKQLMVK
jgi:Secretion system C-terminal sorting domain